MNTTSIVKEYKGSVYTLYTPENYRHLQDIYAKLVAQVFCLCDKVVTCSRGVLSELKEMFGDEYDNFMKELSTSNTTFSDETSPNPTKSIKDTTSCHPEY